MAKRRGRPKIEQRDGYRLFVGGPVPAQADAITLGRTICVRADCADNDGLLAHELVHVHQYQELGLARFLVRYVRSYLRGRLSGYGHMAAYRRIPLEVEADWLSRIHGREALEPGGAAPTPEGMSQVRAPRLASTQIIQDRAEDLGLDVNLLAGAGRRTRTERRSTSRLGPLSPNANTWSLFGR